MKQITETLHNQYGQRGAQVCADEETDMKFDVELVGKIGSMALIDKHDNMIDYTRVARLSRELRPGYIWISSGATEIGRLDYIMRAGHELPAGEDAKTDYAAQGQAILMQTYRQYVDSKYSVRQILVEHHHFNDEVKREHIKKLLLRCKDQNAIPIVNYNDAVSQSENRRMEISALAKSQAVVHECIDNDETASLVACLVHAKTLLILTSVDGIYTDPRDPSTLIEEIAGKNDAELLDAIEHYKRFCEGASREGAGGAKAKLEYVKEAAAQGTEVLIANARYSLREILAGDVRCTRIHIR